MVFQHCSTYFLRVHYSLLQVSEILQVGMADISFDTNPRALSDGYKRRLALAVQLVFLINLFSIMLIFIFACSQFRIGQIHILVTVGSVDI